MSITIEKESRLEIDKSQYEKLVKFYYRNDRETPYFSITNIYLDTKDNKIIKSKNMLRIRYFNNEENIELTLKIKGSNGDKEITQKITNIEMSTLVVNGIFPDGEVSYYLLNKKVNVNDIVPFATLKTKRLEIARGNSLLVIDENSYFDVIDYDIEVESNSMKTSKEEINKIALMFNIVNKNVYLTKSRRAYLKYIDTLK